MGYKLTEPKSFNQLSGLKGFCTGLNGLKAFDTLDATSY